MRFRIEQVQWHDAQIGSFALVTVADSFDTVKLSLVADHFVDEFGKHELSLRIDGCYKIRMDMNLWITGPDSISRVSIHEKSKWIEEESARFVNGFGPKVVFHFELVTNTNSRIEALVTRKDCIEVLQ